MKPANDTKQARAFWGMQRTLVDNLVTGVTAGMLTVIESRPMSKRPDIGLVRSKWDMTNQHDEPVLHMEGKRQRAM